MLRPASAAKDHRSVELHHMYQECLEMRRIVSYQISGAHVGKLSKWMGSIADRNRFQKKTGCDMSQENPGMIGKKLKILGCTVLVTLPLHYLCSS
jgi:hypothetical protein